MKETDFACCFEWCVIYGGSIQRFCKKHRGETEWVLGDEYK